MGTKFGEADHLRLSGAPSWVWADTAQVQFSIGLYFGQWSFEDPMTFQIAHLCWSGGPVSDQLPVGLYLAGPGVP